MKYEAHKGDRIFYNFMGMTPNFDSSLWWDGKEWTKNPDRTKPYSNYCDCNSLRAFRKRLQKAPKGIEFILVSRWYNYHIYAKRTNK